jgi:Domain of unknown function (DUF4115)
MILGELSLVGGVTLAMQSELLALAKQGNPDAIAALMNEALQGKGITIEASVQDHWLHLLMESTEPLEEERILPALRKAMQDLNAPSIAWVKVYAGLTDEQMPLWTHEFAIKGATQGGTSSSAPDSDQRVQSDDSFTFSHHLKDMGGAPRSQVEPPLENDSTATRSSKRLSYTNGLALLIVGLVVIIGGSLGWLRSRQADLVQRSQQLVATLGQPGRATSLQQLETHQRQLRSSLESLKATAPWLGLEPERSQQIAILNTHLAAVNQKLKVEQQALAQLKMAQQLSARAHYQVAKSPTAQSYALAQQQLKTAIALLEGIPPQSLIATQAQSDLAAYRQYYQAPDTLGGDATPLVAPDPSTQSLVPSGAPQVSAPIRLTLSTTGESWMAIIVDGQVQYEGIPESGSRQTWAAQEELVIQIGNAGAVEVAFKDETPRVLGELGEVVELTYTPNGLVDIPSSDDR